MRTLLLALLMISNCGGCDDPSCVSAPDDAPSCGSAASCFVDDDCAAYPGTWCDPIGCADEAQCLAGRCNLTHVQGQPCERDGACVSGRCLDGVCAPEGLDAGTGFGG